MDFETRVHVSTSRRACDRGRPADPGPGRPPPPRRRVPGARRGEGGTASAPNRGGPGAEEHPVPAGPGGPGTRPVGKPRLRHRVGQPAGGWDRPSSGIGDFVLGAQGGGPVAMGGVRRRAERLETRASRGGVLLHGIPHRVPRTALSRLTNRRVRVKGTRSCARRPDGNFFFLFHQLSGDRPATARWALFVPHPPPRRSPRACAPRDDPRRGPASSEPGSARRGRRSPPSPRGRMTCPTRAISSRIFRWASS